MLDSDTFLNELSKLLHRYKILDSKIAGKTPMTLMAKVLIDQLVTAPPILATFYTGMTHIKDF